MAQEGLKQREFPGRQVNRPLAHLGLAGTQVQAEVPLCQHELFFGVMWAQPCPDPGEKFRQAEWLGQIVVRSAVQAGDDVGGGTAGGQHDDRQPDLLAPQLGQHAGTIQLGQAEVEQHEIELPGPGHIQGAFPIRRAGGGMPLRMQAFGQEPDDMRFILGDEYAAHATTSFKRERGSTPGGAAGRWGTDIRNRAPPPCRSSSATLPPWAAAMAPTMESPSPVPLVRRASRRANRSKIRVRITAGMPGPSSATVNSMAPATIADPISTAVPGGVCATAFAASCMTA